MIQGKLSLVLPAYNEAENIAPVVHEAIAALPRFFDDFEIIIVNDGSQDATGDISKSLASSDSRVRVVTHPGNRGYGAALRSGFDASTGDWVMVMDSDRQFDIGDLIYLAPLIGEYDLVAGYRIERSDPYHRTVFGKTFRLAMRILFGVQLRDIDCAFKVFRGDLLRALPLESEGAMISTEIMARWVRAGGTWTEVGVHHYPRVAGKQSGGSLRVILRAMRDVPALWIKLNREDQDPAINAISSSEARPQGVTPATAAIALVLITVLTIAIARLFRQNNRID